MTRKESFAPINRPNGLSCFPRTVLEHTRDKSKGTLMWESLDQA